MKRFPDLPPIWAAGAALLAILAGRFVPLMRFESPRGLSILLLIAGFLLILWSAYFFWKKRTSIEPHHKPTSLIVEGPYRLSRNPIYLGMYIGLIGVAFWVGAFSALIVVSAFPLIINVRFIRHEEAALLESFGPDAQGYLNSTSRWLFGF